MKLKLNKRHPLAIAAGGRQHNITNLANGYHGSWSDDSFRFQPTADDVWAPADAGLAGSVSTLDFVNRDGTVYEQTVTLDDLNALCMFGIFQADTEAGDGHTLISFSDTAQAVPGFDFLDVGDGVFRWGYRQEDNGTFYSTDQTGATLVDNRWYACIGVRRSTSLDLWWKDLVTGAVEYRAESSTISFAARSPRTTMCIGGIPSSANNLHNHRRKTALVGFINGYGLEENVARQWLDNPWGIFEPRRFFVPLIPEVTIDDAGDGNHTATPGSATLSLTGYVPDVISDADVTRTPSNESLALTGQTPDTSEGFFIEVPMGPLR